MVMTYQTREGDMLDDICWRYYERVDVVIDVLDTNPGLAEYGAVLPKGLMILLPEIEIGEAIESIGLWD